MDLPSYGELPVTPGAPDGSSWGLWGPDDRLGTLNLLTPERVLRAAQLIRRGAVFPLDWDWSLPDPPLFGRQPMVHRVVDGGGDFVDDVIDAYNTQSSSQWDGFRHVAVGGQLYNGLGHDDHGVDHWARKGIVGRGVLVDIAAYRAAQGRPLALDRPEDVGADELLAILEHEQVTVETGDVLLVHVGYTQWYLGLDQATRTKIGSIRAPRCPGLRAGRDMVALLWDLHIAAVASDTPSFEVAPFSRGLSADEEQSSYATLHHNLLPLLGVPIGELWDLAALAADCADDGVYECFLTSSPIKVRNGVGSPPNALAIK